MRYQDRVLGTVLGLTFLLGFCIELSTLQVNSHNSRGLAVMHLGPNLQNIVRQS